MKSYIKKELGTIHLASDGSQYVSEEEALIRESVLDEIREKDRRWETMKTNIAELVLEVLKNEGWGIFFKTEPIQVLPVQDSETTLYKVNEVNPNTLSESLKLAIQRKTEERNEQEWESHQTGQKQIDNELSTGTKKMSNDTGEWSEKKPNTE